MLPSLQVALVSLALTGLASCSAPDRSLTRDAAGDVPDYPTDIPFEVLHCDIRSESSFGAHIQSRGDWATFVATYPPATPYKEVPTDFERHDVIAIGLGMRPTTRYSVRVLGIGRDGPTVRVTYLETEPGNCSVGYLATYPCVLVVTGRISTEPAYNHRVHTESCSDGT